MAWKLLHEGQFHEVKAEFDTVKKKMQEQRDKFRIEFENLLPDLTTQLEAKSTAVEGEMQKLQERVAAAEAQYQETTKKTGSIEHDIGSEAGGEPAGRSGHGEKKIDWTSLTDRKGMVGLEKWGGEEDDKKKGAAGESMDYATWHFEVLDFFR